MQEISNMMEGGKSITGKSVKPNFLRDLGYLRDRSFAFSEIVLFASFSSFPFCVPVDVKFEYTRYII